MWTKQHSFSNGPMTVSAMFRKIWQVVVFLCKFIRTPHWRRDPIFSTSSIFFKLLSYTSLSRVAVKGLFTLSWTHSRLAESRSISVTPRGNPQDRFLEPRTAILRQLTSLREKKSVTMDFRCWASEAECLARGRRDKRWQLGCQVISVEIIGL